MTRADIDEDKVPWIRPGARVEHLALGVAQRAWVVVGDDDPPRQATLQRVDAILGDRPPAEIFSRACWTSAAVGVLSLAWVVARKDSRPTKRRRVALSQARCRAIRRNSSYSAGRRPVQDEPRERSLRGLHFDAVGHETHGHVDRHT